jgi:hypothetical protein
MADLIILKLENGDIIRCADLADAKAKAIHSLGENITLEITPDGIGGPITTLKFEKFKKEWIPE